MFEKLGHVIFKRRKSAVILFIVGILVAGGFGSLAFSRLDSGGYSDPKSDSYKVYKYLTEELKLSDPAVVIIVDSGSTDVTDPVVAQKGIALEKKIVKTYKPKILCLRSMAMDNLSKNTIPVFAPWFTEKHECRFSKKDNSVWINSLRLSGSWLRSFNQTSSWPLWSTIANPCDGLLIGKARMIRIFGWTMPCASIKLIAPNWSFVRLKLIIMRSH